MHQEFLTNDEVWRPEGDESHTEDGSDNAWFWPVHEWGHPWPIPCAVCGRTSRIPVTVNVLLGTVLFGACSPAHADVHRQDVTSRFAQAPHLTCEEGA